MFSIDLFLYFKNNFKVLDKVHHELRIYSYIYTASSAKFHADGKHTLN